ncbi:glutamate synthase-related protein [Dielma fastidiosa]|uniref:glutamate synthase (NADPH) n=1 Tax=Dielma fastidiosa TaxID=1034346 RepID=A0A318KXN6_9FIRM|nr:glutamate synthase-related protein [Dielma fastidiosa]PXX81658.1 glutamate synthase (NADPH) GltB2 subunit [Dielma fastidiosa]
MNNQFKLAAYEIVRDLDRCDNCHGCEVQCANGVHFYDQNKQKLLADPKRCVNCQRCVVMCHTHAIKIIKNPNQMHENQYWQSRDCQEIYAQACSGGILLSSMGNPRQQKIYWDHLLLNASQVTNPSIDPLREPMETRVFLGARTQEVKRDEQGHLIMDDAVHLKLETPILFSAMSLGAISYNAHQSLLNAAKACGTYYNTGEGGLHESFYADDQHIIVQVASGSFSVEKRIFDHCAAIEIKIGQGAKPGIGGHLPAIKNTDEIAAVRMIKPNTEAISPALHHDIYSIEDLRQLVLLMKEISHYQKPVIVKVAAVHNIAAIASGIARSGADIIEIDGYRGGTGAAPTRIRDHVGIPIELALASVDQRLREEGIRERVSLVVSGGIRNSADVVKAIALGADAVSIGTAALLALGCHLCQDCTSGNCNWGIATQKPELCTRLQPAWGSRQLIHLLNAWTREIKEMMGGMGINSIEALRGNRLMLAALDLNETECEILGVRYAGR